MAEIFRLVAERLGTLVVSLVLEITLTLRHYKFEIYIRTPQF